jgi:hypothetical protein
MSGSSVGSGERQRTTALTKAPCGQRRRILSGSVALALLITVVIGVSATAAFATIDGTFVSATLSGSCTLAPGYSSIGSSCVLGNDYLYLHSAGGSVTYSFTVPSGTSATLTYGIPAGGYINTAAGTVSLDGGAPVTVNSNLGGVGLDQTTPTDLSLWTSSVLAAGAHTWTITSTGDSVNVYGLWLDQVGVTVPCGTGTTSCAATLTVPTQKVAVAGTKTSPMSATISVQVATSTLSCTNFSYSAPVVTLTDAGLESGTSVSVTDTVTGLPSKKGVLICYQPVGISAPPPVLLGKCHGKKFTGACTKSITEDAGKVVAQLLVPAGDPRFHIGGGTPVVSSFSPASPKAGKKLTIKGSNLSEVTGVTIGGVGARIVKTAPTKVSVIAPAQAHGVIVVTSLAGVTASVAVVAVA